jgi:hypothetical protein
MLLQRIYKKKKIVGLLVEGKFKDIYEIIDFLWWHDIYILSSPEDGWIYLIDVNYNAVYSVNDYMIDRFEELLQNKRAVFPSYGTIKQYIRWGYKSIKDFVK